MVKSQQSKIIDLMYSKHLISPKYIENELSALGKSFNLSDLSIEDLLPLDQDHFGGVDATQICINAVNICHDATVLDIGSGLGGPSRYIAWRTGCSIDGVEIQEDRYQCAVDLTRRVGFQEKVKFILGDVTKIAIKEATYTHVISFLSILHIIGKRNLLKNIGDMLKTGGRIYIEDYCRGEGYTPKHNKLLLENISCPSLLSRDEYVESLKRVGIQIDEECDVTSEWSSLAKRRCDDFENNMTEKIKIHGREPIQKAMQFSKDVLKLFNNNIITGIRLVGTKA
jgi:cyclopropane fatty-acyl-phospholipid synthase-like methyltransferase